VGKASILSVVDGGEKEEEFEDGVPKIQKDQLQLGAKTERPRVDFTNILRAAFTRANPKSAKRQCLFCTFEM